MPKNIVICSDGTGNTANKNRGTNVFKIFEAVDLRITNFDSPQDNKTKIEKQVTIYDDGVGSQSFIVFKILGGAFGWGLKRNVKQLYTELARVYEQGDSIYAFGFSRGAFTIRTLIGFLADSGIPEYNAFNNKKGLDTLVDHAYKHYQRNYRSLLSRICFPDWLGKLLPESIFNFLPGFIANRIPFGDPYKPKNYHQKPAIKFVGVWDTVAAVGLPFDWATDLWNKLIYRFSFKNNNLYSKVEKACHAVSIDDERQTFHPMLWNENQSDYVEKDEKGQPIIDKNGNTIPLKSDKAWDSQWIEQVWFPGVHSNVGGGYPKQGISLVTLHWMMRRAYNAGLMFKDEDWDAIRGHGNITDKLYKSRAGAAVYYRYLPRDIQKLCKKHGVICKIHESFRERISLGSEGYAPGNLPPVFQLVKDKPGEHDDSNYSKKVFQKGNSEKGSQLWSSLQPFIFARRQGYHLLLGITLLGIGIYLCGLFDLAETQLAADNVSDPGCLDHLKIVWDKFAPMDLLMSFKKNYLWVGLLVAFGISWSTRATMQSRRTEFWHQHRRT